VDLLQLLLFLRWLLQEFMPLLIWLPLELLPLELLPLVLVLPLEPQLVQLLLGW
jgi:hypothetical protein